MRTLIKISNDDADDEGKGCEELEGAGSGLVKQPLVSAPLPIIPQRKPWSTKTSQLLETLGYITDFRQIRQFYLLIRISKCPILGKTGILF